MNRASIPDWIAEIDLAKDEVLETVDFLDHERAPQPNDANSELVRLGNVHKPTKIPHNYLPRYAHVFDDIRMETKVFLEIGVQTDVSVKTWKDYFPNAKIYGLDIDPDCAKFSDDRIEILIGDQTDPDFLKQVIKTIGEPIDIIVDDGLHSTEAIMTSFKYLYPALGPYGIYAIEDIIANEEVNAFLMDVIAAIQHWPKNVPGALWPILREFNDNPGWFVENTIGLEVYRYLAFIKRGFNPLTNPNFMTDEEAFGTHNHSLGLVKKAYADLAAEGLEPTRERLVEKVGFQESHAIAWYDSGMHEAKWENWTRFREKQLANAAALPPKTLVQKLSAEVERLRAENDMLRSKKR